MTTEESRKTVPEPRTAAIRVQRWAGFKTRLSYGDAVDAFPTSPDDVIGWLRDHYREHVPHAEELLADWRASRPQ